MISTYLFLFKYFLCKLKNWRHKVDQINSIGAGLIAPFALLFEPLNRRVELTIYMFPRFAEAFWGFLVKRKIVKNIRNGEVILFAIALSIICYSYQNE